MSGTTVERLDRMLDRGLVLFLPTYVRRLYRDGGRLGLYPGPGGPNLSRARPWRPERWIASTVRATSTSPRSTEGLSRLALTGDGSAAITFRQALQWRGQRILGESGFRRYESDFPLLVKILDPGEPIVLHFHARDKDVRRHPQRFPGQHAGKDEAYYFLPAARGSVPYTHVGLHPGVTRRILAEAIARGTALDLSPVIHQRPGEGLLVPAGIPHRPGTALTLEIQQPSDVFTLLEHRWGDRPLSPAEMHPGFASIEDALTMIDYRAATDPRLLERLRLLPEPVEETRSRGGEEFWIFPPRLRKFSGKRLVVRTRFESQEAGPYVLLVWRGRGRLLGHRLQPGTEALVTAEFATRPQVFTADDGPLEAFKLLPPI